MEKRTRILVLGAGPAGLTAAYEALRDSSVSVTILEISGEVGGISRTVERNGFRFDLGGHRFFTKVSRVKDFWNEILEPEDFMLRPRMSRIFYDGKLFDYPLRPLNALRGLGFLRALRCLGSFFWVKIKRPRNQENFENWVASRFGWYLYRIFFKTYTEKVWGMDASKISSDWASQRIKNLNLIRAILDAFGFKKRGEVITTLIDTFHYPKYGPGMLWERCLQRVVEKGARIHFQVEATAIKKLESGELEVEFSNGHVELFDALISSIPLKTLPELLNCKEESVIEARSALKFRDFLTVALVVNKEEVFPDNWIYIHSPEVQVGRVQNYGSWSPYMVKEGTTCLGLEYFVNEEDELWSKEDSQIIEIATRELLDLELLGSGSVLEGYVIRVPKAYPVYDDQYKAAVATIAAWIERDWPNVYAVGRNGMHRYNNQDHSMLTAMLAVENIIHSHNHDLWSVNVDSEYHEEVSENSSTQRVQPQLIK